MENFTVKLARGVAMTIRVRYIKESEYYDVYSTADRLHGTLYFYKGVWKSDDHISPMVIQLLGGLIEMHQE